MPALYHVDYADPHGWHHGVKYEVWADAIRDIRKRLSCGFVKAEVYKFFPKFDMYLYMDELNTHNRED